MSASPLFSHTYASLPERFYARVQPTPVRAPSLIRVNAALAEELGLDPEWLRSAEGVAMLAGNSVPAGALPIAQAYAGHQFGGLVPQLGDGRAMLLGEVVDRHGGRRDVQLKGAGPTPFSRRGDGRAALGPVLREYVLSEAMAALGVPTTRALAAVRTGEELVRETVVPGAVFTRVAGSHIRVGTFVYFAQRGDDEALRLLADYVIARHYPAAAAEAEPYRALLRGIISRQAALIARWLLLGFIHGVMNTDNMSIAGETIDFGPCAFLDHYDPQAVFSSIDRHGRYAYSQQPGIGQWNLTRLAECFLPLLAGEEKVATVMAEEELKAYAPAFAQAYEEGLRQKLGLARAEEEDVALTRELLQTMVQTRADWTLTFRRLTAAAYGPEPDAAALRSAWEEPAAAEAWLLRWHRRGEETGLPGPARQQSMGRVNPAYIPRNHQVEAVIRAAVDREDFTPFETLLEVLAQPYEEQAGRERYAAPPAEHELVRETFCGT